MHTEPDFDGIDLEWFALDREGNAALFATAGCGPVPAWVTHNVSGHQDLAVGLQISDWGTARVWQSYAKVGLFAYDWNALECRYVRVATPSDAVAPALRDGLDALELPALQRAFATCSTLVSADLEHHA